MLSVPRNWAGWVTAAAVALLALFTAVEASSALGHAQRLRIVAFEDLKTSADAASRAHEARLALDRGLHFTGNRARSEMASARAADEAFRKLLDRIDAAGEPEIGARLSACRNSWSAFRVLLRQTGDALEAAPADPGTLPEETLNRVHQAAMADLGNLRVAIDAAALRWESELYQALLLGGGGAFSLSALTLGVLSWRARERRRSLESQRQANRELAAAREALLLSHQTLEHRVRLRTAELEAEAARNQRIQEELARAKEAAEEASSVKTAFLTNMSHELRTPLNAILGYCQLLMEDAAERSPDMLPDLERIRVAGSELKDLVVMILSLSKLDACKDAGQPSRILARHALAEAADVLRPLAERNRNTVTVSCPDELELETEPRLFRDSLLSLVSNACKFTRSGSVTIAAELIPHAGGAAVKVDVRDTGIGIRPEHLDKIFEPFWQADHSSTREYGGVGLGLTACKRMCKLIGAKIAVESRPGSGSTFTLILPAAAPDA